MNGGSLPSVERLRPSQTPGALWVVRDDREGVGYGGNKARKFRGILEEAHARGAHQLCSVGAAGSHQIVATAILARRVGLRARCFAVAQPDVPESRLNLRRALAAGAELVACRSELEAALRLGRAGQQPRTLAIPVGGSSLHGSLPFVEVMRARFAGLLEQTDARPLELVVGLGSGGTTAGLVVGALLAEREREHGRPHVARFGEPALRVRAVTTAGPRVVVRGLLYSMIARLLRHYGALPLLPQALARLTVVDDQLGAGYAHPTAASRAALRSAAELGLHLDPVYTAKAFAHAQERAMQGRRIVFWHTLSTVDLSWLDHELPSWEQVPSALRRLML